MINLGLAREIYGLQPWFIDQETLPSYLGMLKAFQSGVAVESPETKYNSPFLLKLSSNSKVIDRPYGSPWDPGQLDNDEKFTGVGIINIDGPITVSGGMSSIGMRQLSNHMTRMSLDSRIIGFMIYCDSGGGSSGAVEIMSDTINQIKKFKPVDALVKKGGMAGSACYGIISPCNNIWVESEMSIVGSCGTMIQFEGKKANSEDQDKFKYVRLYATKSTLKNKGYEDALNSENYEVIINELLDPVNESFLKLLETNRPKLKGTDFDNGNTKFAKDSIGTFIDGIKSFDEVVESLSKKGIEMASKVKKNNSKINSTMNIETLKNEHLDLYNSVFNLGVKAESERVGTWMAHLDTDLEIVRTGVKSGEELSQTQREELLIKATSLNGINSLQEDSTEPIVTKPSGQEETNETEADAFYASVDEALKTK